MRNLRLLPAGLHHWPLSDQTTQRARGRRAVKRPLDQQVHAYASRNRKAGIYTSLSERIQLVLFELEL